MSPSLREALASLTSDRRFAEITASFNGMNLRQRFPNLTREEQAEIVRAAREFVQKQPAAQAQTETSQRSRLEPHPEAASDLRGSPPPQEPDPDPLLQPPESTETVEDIWVTAPETEPYPEATVPIEVEAEERDFRQPASLLGRPLLTGLAVVAAFVVAWFIGRQIMTPDPHVAEEGVIEQPVAEEMLESSISTVDASTEPKSSAEPAMLDKPDLDRPVEPLPDDARVSASSDADPESRFAENIQSPPGIPASMDSVSGGAPELTEAVDSDTTDSMVSETESPIEDEVTVADENAEAASVETPPASHTPTVATLPGPSDNTDTETPPETEAVVEEAPESRPSRPATASKNPVLVSQIQARLKMVGYDPGPIDGVPGPKTSNAIRAFQGDRGLRVDGEPSELLLGILATYSGLQDTSAQPATQ